MNIRAHCGHWSAMPRNNHLPKNSRARRALHAAFVLAAFTPCPFIARAQGEPPAPNEVLPVQVAPALTPPRLLEDSAPALRELPVGSETATLLIELTIDKDGSARDAVVVSSAGEALDGEALNAVNALRFEPARRNGEPIVARIPFRFDFKAALPPPPPPAAPPPTPPSPAEPAEMQELTFDVQGQKPPRETTVYTLKSEELRKLPGTNGDPLRAVESLPGVARPPSFNPFLSVRGSGPNDTGIFIDGIQIPLSYHFGGFASVVPGDALEKFELRPGNFGAEYGRAMGGVLELGLRAPRRDRVGGMAQLDPIDGRFLIEGPLRKRTRFMIAGRRSWVDAWLGKLDDTIKSAPVYYDSQVLLEHDLSARTNVRLFFVGSDDRLKLLFDAPDPQDPGNAGKLQVGTRFTRLGLRADSKLSDNVSSRLTLSWGTDHLKVNLGTEHQDINANTLDARGELRARLNDWVTSVLGIDTQFWRYDVQLRVRPYTPDNGGVDGPNFAQPTRAFGDQVWLVRPAAFTMLELTPAPGLRIVPGVRADYSRDTGGASVDPRVSVRYDVRQGFPRTTLKGGVGKYSQPPQGVESVKPFGSNGVRSNRALHYGLGVEQELAPGLSLSLEGFYKHLYGLVVAQAAENQDNVGASFDNKGSGRIYGGESLLRYSSQRWLGWASYTLTRSERKDAPDQAYRLFQYDQTHILTVLGNVTLARNWTLGARWRYVSGMPTTPLTGGVADLDAGAYAPIAGKYFGDRVPAFHQLDLRVDKTWQLRHAKLTAYLELRNTYNRKNSDSLGYKYDYSQSKPQSTLPLIPVLGLRGDL
jgi:TonB family protein